MENSERPNRSPQENSVTPDRSELSAELMLEGRGDTRFDANGSPDANSPTLNGILPELDLTEFGERNERMRNQIDISIRKMDKDHRVKFESILARAENGPRFPEEAIRALSHWGYRDLARRVMRFNAQQFVTSGSF